MTVSVLLRTFGLLYYLFAGVVHGAPISVEPQVRIVQTMHSGRIEQIRADASFKRLYTVSADKSLRIWRMSDLTLLRQVYLPAEAGAEGMAMALAVSADGEQVFVAGITGWAWSGASTVYRIAPSTGRIVATLGRFMDDVVASLDLSPDGKQLAVGLAKGGLRVLSTQSGELLRSDTAYAGTVTFVHHAVDGRLATTSTDGCLRLYGANGVLQLRYQYPKRSDEPQCTGEELGGVRFSPDGRLLAYGSRVPARDEGRAPRVVVLDVSRGAPTLSRVVATDDPAQMSLCCIAWSTDSRTLYVNGQADDRRPLPLFRVSPVTGGPVQRWAVGRQQFTNMLPLPDGDVVFSTAVPSLVRIAADGLVRSTPNGRPLVVEPDTLDFFVTRESIDSLRVSPDGKRVNVQVPGSLAFSLNLGATQIGEVLTVGGGIDKDLRGASMVGALKVDTDLGFFGYRRPTLVNGHPVALQHEESVWSWAVHATLPLAAIATQWRLLLLDASGRPARGWQNPPVLPAPAYHTLITDDGRWIVAALGDGTLRWFSVQTGQEMLGAFIHADGEEWVAWERHGFYMSSPQGDNYLAFIRNRDEHTEPDLIRAVQLERALFRPDLVKATIDSPKLESQDFDPSHTLGARRLNVPRVRIESISEASRELTFSVEPADAAVTTVGVFANGIPALAMSEQLVQQGKLPFRKTVKIPDALKFDELRVEAEAGNLIGMDIAGAVQPQQRKESQGRLWIVTVGVERIEDFEQCTRPDKNCQVQLSPLPNASSDSLAMGQALKDLVNTGLFSKVDVQVLTEHAGRKPVKAAILQALERLQQSRPEDTVVFFMASHGLIGGTSGEEYYMVPADAKVADVEKLIFENKPRPTVPTLLSASELAALMRRVPGRRFLVLDSCHAGAADGSANPYAMAKRSASAQVGVLSAAHGSELSWEHVDAKIRHGAFTYALLQGLRGGAADASGQITVESLFRYARPLVKANADAINTASRARGSNERDVTQTPVLTALPALRDSVLSRRP